MLGTRSMNTTQKSVANLRKDGYLCQNVEKYNSFTKRRNDLFGFIDILCVKENDVLGVQTTSKDNMSSRKKKILEHENYSIVKASGIRIRVHGWKKEKNGRYTLSEVDL